MDNGFFVTLIYIFIIIIFLSSLFRKKARGTKGKPLPGVLRMPEENKNADAVSMNYYNSENARDNKEIMEEIGRLFEKENQSGGGENMPGKPPERKETKIETYYREAREKAGQQAPDDYSKWPGSEIKSTVQTVIKEKGIVESELIMVDSKIEKEARDFEKLLNPRQEENKLVGAIREKISDIQTLKEFIVFNEILGKPKALRR